LSLDLLNMWKKIKITTRAAIINASIIGAISILIALFLKNRDPDIKQPVTGNNNTQVVTSGDNSPVHIYSRKYESKSNQQQPSQQYSKNNIPKKNIKVSELLKELDIQLKLLQEYYEKSKEDTIYIKEVSVKLRLLVGNDGALLISLMHHFNIWPRIKMNSPFNEEFTLKEYLQSLSVAGQTPEGIKEINNQEFINFVAEQDGGISKPWSIDSVYAILRDRGMAIYFNNTSLFVRDMQGKARIILQFGKEFLKIIKERPNLYK